MTFCNASNNSGGNPSVIEPGDEVEDEEMGACVASFGIDIKKKSLKLIAVSNTIEKQ
jgi:hypothetical protein